MGETASNQRGFSEAPRERRFPNQTLWECGFGISSRVTSTASRSRCPPDWAITYLTHLGCASSPYSAEEGWLREAKKAAKPPKPRRRVGVGQDFKSWPAPPRPLHQRLLRAFLLDVAATPPRLRRGRRIP